MRRGEVAGRAEVVFHQPWIRERLGILDKSNFTVRNLGTIIDEIRYGTGSPPTYLDESENTVPFVRATDIKDGEVNLETLLHVAAEQPGRMNKYRLTGGELIIVRSGANTGDCAVVPHLLANALAAYDLILTFKSDISAKFVAAFLDTEIGRLQLNLVKGRSAQPHINAAEVAALQILLPPITEQQNLVDAIDTAREERRAKVAEADALLAGIDGFLLDSLGMMAPVDDGRRVFAVSSEGVFSRLDPHFHSPAFARIERMLAQVNCEPLGRIATFSKETWRPQDHGQPTFRYIEINTANPQTGEANWNEVPTLEAPSRARMKVQAKDIIVSLTRPHHGSIAYLGPEFDGCIASTGFAVIRNVPEHISRDYLWCVLRAQFCLQQMLQRASGGNYPAITEPELAKILVPVPDKAIQNVIAAEVSRRSEDARRLRAEAEAGWEGAKGWFEEELLGADNATQEESKGPSTSQTHAGPD